MDEFEPRNQSRSEWQEPTGQPFQQPRKNTVAVPIAIIIAGALIAGSLFLSRGGANGASNTAAGQAAAAAQANGQNQQLGNVNNALPLSSSDHLLGDTNAPITLVEYSDLECPYCKEFQTTMQQLMDTYGQSGQLAWVYRNFPLYLTLHPKAEKEAEAAECANQLGGNAVFWKYINEIYQITPSNNGLDPTELPKVASDVGLNVPEFNTCLSSGQFTSAVEQDYQNALKAGGSGTPYIVLFLKTALNATQQQAVLTAMQNALQQIQPGATLPAGFVTFSTDGTRVAWEGAFPEPVDEAILNAILGK